MQAKLEEIVIEEVSADNAITIRMNGNKRVLDITIDSQLVAQGDSEQIEDLLLVTFNSAMEKAEAASEGVMRDQINDLLPGGLGQIFGG